MSRLTITLSDERHRALKETAARQRKTIGQIVGEGLDLYGVKTRASAVELVRRARTRAAQREDEALKLAVKETRAVRRG